MLLPRAGHFLLHEFRQILRLPFSFSSASNFILLTKRLILGDYLVQSTGFFIATASALVVSKVVLVGDMMPFFPAL
jgi:hypothetical protein